MVRSRIRVLAAALAMAALLGGCTAQRAYQEGNALVAQEQVRELAGHYRNILSGADAGRHAVARGGA